MSAIENKAVVRRLVEEVQSGGGNVELVDEILSKDFIDHTPLPGLPATKDGVKVLFTAFHRAFPDLRVTIKDQIAEGEKVTTRKTFTGTHKGDFLGVPASGRNVEFEVIDILRIVDGRVTEHWAVVNQLQLMQQLGAIPS
jgi:steroid delta-isomerase-like uncharacterized protein